MRNIIISVTSLTAIRTVQSCARRKWTHLNSAARASVFLRPSNGTWSLSIDPPTPPLQHSPFNPANVMPPPHIQLDFVKALWFDWNHFMDCSTDKCISFRAQHEKCATWICCEWTQRGSEGAFNYDRKYFHFKRWCSRVFLCCKSIIHALHFFFFLNVVW